MFSLKVWPHLISEFLLVVWQLIQFVTVSKMSVDKLCNNLYAATISSMLVAIFVEEFWLWHKIMRSIHPSMIYT